MAEFENRKWVIPKAGSIARLELRSTPLTALEAGFIRVRSKAVGLNFADIFAVTGLYSATPAGAFVPGLEFSGIVEEVNADCNLQPGDRVIGVTRFGAYAEYVDVKPTYLIALPADWDYAQGAALLAQTLTAYYALTDLGAVKKGMWVLVHSAAGGVGLQAQQICKSLGVNTIGTVSTQSKIDFLKELGFPFSVKRGPNWTEEVQTILTKEQGELLLVLDAIGGRVQQASYDLMASTGRLVVFGAAVFTPHGNRPNLFTLLKEYLGRPRFDPLKMTSENKSVMAFNLIWMWQKSELMHRMIDEIASLKLPPPYVGERFQFSEAKSALKLFQSGKTKGKVVLEI